MYAMSSIAAGWSEFSMAMTSRLSSRRARCLQNFSATLVTLKVQVDQLTLLSALSVVVAGS